MPLLKNKTPNCDIMEHNVLKEGEQNIENPHYIALNVLEIAKVEIPLKKEVFIFDIDETLFFEPLYLDHLFIETVTVLSEMKNIPYEDACKLYLEIQDGKGMYIKKLMVKHELPSQFCIDIYIRLIKKDLIKYDKKLREMLFELKKTKTLICFTNGPEVNARYILETLGVSKTFDLVIVNDFARKAIHKPQVIAYKVVNEGLNLTNKKVEKIVFFDDYLANCTGATEAGWQSYHIGPENNIYLYLNQFLKKEINE